MTRIARQPLAAKVRGARVTHTLHVRMSADERKLVAKLAKRLKLDISDTVRVALKQLDEKGLLQ